MTVVFEEREGGESIGGEAADTLSPRSLRNESCHSERREESTSKPLQFVYFSFLRMFGEVGRCLLPRVALRLHGVIHVSFGF